MAGRVGRNFAFLAASSLLAPIFSMVLVLAISRLRGVEELGKYSLVMTWFVVGQSVAGFGLPVIVTREVAQRRAQAGRYFLAASLVSFVLVLPLLLGGALALWWWQQDPQLRVALLLMLAVLLPSGVAQAGEGVLLAFERASDFVLINLGETILRAVVGSALVFAGYGVREIAGAILVLRALAAVAFAVVLRWRGVSFGGGVDLATCRSLAREAPVVGAIPIVNQLYARADVFLLSTLGSWADVGLYSAALRLVDIARTVPPAYARALYPVLARLQEDRAQFVGVARAALRRTAVLAVALTLALAVLAQPLIVLLFGARLAAAAAPLRVMAWTLVPQAVAVTLAQMLFATGNQAIDLRVNVIALVVSVGANVLLIPRFGAVGAASAVVVAATLYAGLQYHWVRRHVADPALGGTLRRLAALALAAVVAAVVLRSMPHVGGLVALAAYAVGVVGMGLVRPAELEAGWRLATQGPSDILKR